ncbi:histone deacetylase [Paramarasmius palmivorus]|uniref:Histone deacetylase n=1 Tax=Paramarasmius palmivorus TaxID=297713 RepID=A0AAW0DTR4_9AGAR
MPPIPRNSAIFIQDVCYKHKFIRSRDTSTVVERPERVRAVKVGIAAALARLEEVDSMPSSVSPKQSDDSDVLAAALDKMKLDGPSTTQLSTYGPIAVIHSSASVPLLGSAAVKFVHGDIEGDVYLENICKWAAESTEKIGRGESEIPEGLPQGDLYLCPESISAVEGAVGTTCEAVDTVISGSLSSGSPSGTEIKRAFVAVRPPGHHCGEDSPCGFCFVNNVAVAGAHAHLKHGIQRIVIFDIDLHHGNGTQSIIWQINEETYRQTLEAEAGAPITKPGPKIYYGSVHDILSFPCEDGKSELVQAASVSIHDAHGQWIENVHLKTYESEEGFHDLYEKEYKRVIERAEHFIASTGGPGEDVLVFISCGMDACEHEYTSMSRHNRKVPVSFFDRFTRDACAFADKYAQGRLVSVLEGGYSDRALISGTLAHICGIVDLPQESREILKESWALENLTKLEKATKKRTARSARPSGVGTSSEPWLERAVAIFTSIDANGAAILAASSKAASRSKLVPPSTRTLRERKKPATSDSAASSPNAKGTKGHNGRVVSTAQRQTDASDGSSLSSLSDDEDQEVAPALGGGVSGTEKKLPRVILRLGPDPSAK